ncbi:MAG: PTS system mannose/fructose/sorbose family transporter subunit IID [Elusimicrobiota bacterium]
MISFIDRVYLLFRSFFLQAVFNYERFQNIGFLFSIAPLIKKTLREAEVKGLFERHSEIFNTQPYMSCFVMGNILKMELERKDKDEIKNIKQSLACAYASVGDRIFWSRLRVILAETTFIIFVPVYFWFSQTSLIEGIAVSVLTPTIFYISYTLYIRYIGIVYGIECGGSKNCGLDKFNWNKIIRIFSRVAFFMTVLLYIIALFLYGFFYISLPDIKETIIYLSLPFCAFFIQRYFRKDKKNIFYPITAMILLSFLFGFFV